jgi:hypothetical protein
MNNPGAMHEDPTYNVFRERGIDPDTKRGRAIIEERGYVHYEAGDVETIYRSDERLRAYPHWVSNVARRSDGWVIPKHAVMPDHQLFGEKPLSQLRPDKPVPARMKGHDHDGMWHLVENCPCGYTALLDMAGHPYRHGRYEPTGNRPEDRERRKQWKADPGLAYYQKPIKARREHEDGKHHLFQDGPNAGQPIPLEGDAGRFYDPDTGSGPHLHGTEDRWNSRGEFVPGTRSGKYQLTPKTAPAPADSTTLIDPKTGRAEEMHRERWPDELDPAEEAVYGNPGKRLDCNPLSRDEFGTAERVFFSFESTLISDALVAAGEVAFNDPSVTLWDTGVSEFVFTGDPDARESWFEEVRHSELEEFAHRYFVQRRIPVIVICDSDWHRNDMVWTQAQLCADLLRGLGLDVATAAPEEGRVLGRHHRTGKPIREKVGVDDFLGPRGVTDPDFPHGGPLDLRVYRTELSPNFPRLVQNLEHHRGPRGGRLDRETVRRAAKTVEYLSTYLNDDLRLKWYAGRHVERLRNRGVDTDHRKFRRDIALLEDVAGVMFEDGETGSYYNGEERVFYRRPGTIEFPEALRPGRSDYSVGEWLTSLATSSLSWVCNVRYSKLVALKKRDAFEASPWKSSSWARDLFEPRSRRSE